MRNADRTHRSLMEEKPINVALYFLEVTVGFGPFPTYTSAHILTTETKNIVNEENGGYDNVYEYIPVGTPSPATISKIAAIKPSKSVGDRKLFLVIFLTPS
jgi:hypothetical protein